VSQTINTNVMSLNAQRNLNTTKSQMSTAVQRLSSGLRVNSSKDDAAGLAIATRMDATARGLNVAMRNAQDAISLSQTAEGAIGQLTDALQRMRELAVQSANGTNNTGDRLNLDAEFQQLSSEVARVIGSTTFNGTALLNGSAGAFSFQVGAGTSAQDTISVSAANLSGISTGVGALSVSGGTSGNSITAIGGIDSMLDTLTTERAKIGATQNRFEAVISSLQVAAENTIAAKGRIMDADYAVETSNLTRVQILQQAGTAMLAQANQTPQSVLALLK
jgi:flagellin